jgi:hypothetical protein
MACFWNNLNAKMDKKNLGGGGGGSFMKIQMYRHTGDMF